MTDFMPRVYFLVRTDLASMTTGRIAAQVSHAAQVFEKSAAKTLSNQINDRLPEIQEIKSALKKWMEQDKYQKVGTAIVLDAKTEEELFDTIVISSSLMKGCYEDPEYHLQDGDHCWIIPNVKTVGYVFAYKPEHKEDLSHLELL